MPRGAQPVAYGAMFEEGLVTLAKILATLIIPMGVIPVLFLLAPGGDTKEPTDVFNTD